jgi:hypothetical protein
MAVETGLFLTLLAVFNSSKTACKSSVGFAVGSQAPLR